MLVRKSYGDKVKRSKQRNWQLQMMDREMDVSMATAIQEGAERDYEDFLEELEEDKTYRSNVNIFFSELGGRVPCCHGSLLHCVCFKCMAWASVFTQHNITTTAKRNTNIASSIIIHLYWILKTTCVLLSCSNVYSVH